MHTLNLILTLLFSLCCAYQLLYLVLPHLRREKPLPPSEGAHDYAVLICARNEEAVVGGLLQSLRRQTYPAGKLHVFVLADNCSDGTEAAARAGGARVYVRQDRSRVGKGYALEALLAHLREDYPAGFDGYFVFDADNRLEPDYVEQMDRSFSAGQDIVTGYRNSLNYGACWISAGYSLWFLRESRYLNHARHLLGVSCAVSGTGFLFSRAVAEELGGWPFHLLTEDIEFTAWQLTHGRRIAFCAGAVLYDEQPEDFPQSWRQRLRWSRGYLQVFRRYGPALVKGAVRGSFACYDMLMNILPVVLLSLLSLASALAAALWSALHGQSLLPSLLGACRSLGSSWIMLFLLGAYTALTEWKQIHTSPLRKIGYLFTFPFFMLTYLPVGLVSLFRNPGWKPIVHRGCPSRREPERRRVVSAGRQRV
ncbi:MAG: glycosyltransferase [Oscillospiraceae bacterium]|nr:glycosyltransferase [Oscillospiraceae bacterium]